MCEPFAWQSECRPTWFRDSTLTEFAASKRVSLHSTLAGKPSSLSSLLAFEGKFAQNPSSLLFQLQRYGVEQEPAGS